MIFISFHFHFISFHFIFIFISFHFISFSFHFISFHFISFHFISFHFISFHFISFLTKKWNGLTTPKCLTHRDMLTSALCSRLTTKSHHTLVRLHCSCTSHGIVLDASRNLDGRGAWSQTTASGNVSCRSHHGMLAGSVDGTELTQRLSAAEAARSTTPGQHTHGRLYGTRAECDRPAGLAHSAK